MSNLNMTDPDYWQRLADAQNRGSSSGEEGLFVTFYRRPVENKFKSKQEGRVVFEEKDYVRITAPASPNSIVDRPVKLEGKEADPARFPKAWAAFQQRRAGLVDGTPLEGCAFLSPAQVMELKANGVMTVEMLAAVHDGNLHKLGMGGRDLVKRANQFLQGEAGTIKDLRAENAELERKLKQLEAKFEGLMRKHAAALDASDIAEMPEPRPRRQRAAA